MTTNLIRQIIARSGLDAYNEEISAACDAIDAQMARRGEPVACVPADDVIEAIEAWKSAWLRVPVFADRVNKKTREAITMSHNTLHLLLQTAQQCKRMPKGCSTPTGCAEHGCHGACIDTAPPAADLTDEQLTPTDQELEDCFKKAAFQVGTPFVRFPDGYRVYGEHIARAIIAKVKGVDRG